MSPRLAPLFYRAAAVLCATLLAAAAAPREAPQQQLIDDAVHAVRAMHARLGRGFAPLLAHATAALIAPRGKAGDAVLLLHARDGWSEPAFFDATALPSKAPSVLLMMNEHAFDAVLHQRGLPLTGPAALTLSTPHPGVTSDLLLWPGTGAMLDPNGFMQDDAADTAWYGQPRDAPEIVGYTPADLRSSALRGALGR